MNRWSNGAISGFWERCDANGCLRAIGHHGPCRLPKAPALGPGRCQGCGATVWYRKSNAGWRPAWRDDNGLVHRCAVSASKAA